MAMTKDQIDQRFQKWEEQQAKNQKRIKDLKAKVKRDAQRIARLHQKEETLKQQIAGRFVLEKMKTDSSFKVWLEGEIHAHLKTDREKALFGLAQGNQRA